MCNGYSDQLFLRISVHFTAALTYSAISTHLLKALFRTFEYIIVFHFICFFAAFYSSWFKFIVLFSAIFSAVINAQTRRISETTSLYTAVLTLSYMFIFWSWAISTWRYIRRGRWKGAPQQISAPQDKTHCWSLVESSCNDKYDSLRGLMTVYVFWSGLEYCYLCKCFSEDIYEKLRKKYWLIMLDSRRWYRYLEIIIGTDFVRRFLCWLRRSCTCLLNWNIFVRLRR